MDTSLLIKIGITVAAALVGLGYTFLGKQPQDNAVEEASEQIIKQETGVDVDLSPMSEEKK